MNVKLIPLFAMILFMISQAYAGDYSHLDPRRHVPKNLLKQALDFYDANKKIIKKKHTIVVIDYSQHSSKERFYVIDMLSGWVETYLVANGIGSDKDHDGYAVSFSNIEGSRKSSLGFFTTAETYHGANGYSLKLDGLSSTNSMARNRFIVIHGADYVYSGRHGIGRSDGCPAIEQKYANLIIDRIKDGVLIYSGQSKAK